MKEPAWIEESDVHAIHECVLALHGGATGIRDAALLKSALRRPRHHMAHADDSQVIDMAAPYTAGIVRNHPFVDGNRRTGFVICVLFLELNGYRFNAGEEDAIKAVLALAAGDLSEAVFTKWPHAKVQQLRRGTRPR